MDVVVGTQDQLGESPVWVARERALLWLDLDARVLHRWHPSTADHSTLPLPGPAPLGGLALSDAGTAVVLATSSSLLRLDPRSGSTSPVAGAYHAPLADLPHLHFNDAGTDRRGRLWLGTAERTEIEPRAVLLRAGPGGLRVADAGFAVCNGPASSPDGSLLYVSDSLRGEVLVHDVDEDGVLHDRRVLVRVPAEDGLPDGLAVDAEGCLWVAHWGGGRVSRVSPAGEVLARLDVPAPHVTSVAFGGDDLDQLFVTSARHGLDAARLERWPLSGALFGAHPGVRGLPEVPWGGPSGA